MQSMKKPLWKLVALDLDGTLLDLNGRVSALNQKWIGRVHEMGIGVTLVTGRHVSKVLPLVHELSIRRSFIKSNGCEIWSPEGKLIQRVCLTAMQVDWIHEFAKFNRLLYRAYCANGVQDWDPDNDREINFRSGEWLKVLLKPKQSRYLTDLYQMVNDSKLFTVIGYKNDENDSVIALDLHPCGVSKENALQEVCTQIGVAREQVIAFGDESMI